jgi:hypothetical protein
MFVISRVRGPRAEEHREAFLRRALLHRGEKAARIIAERARARARQQLGSNVGQHSPRGERIAHA